MRCKVEKDQKLAHRIHRLFASGLGVCLLALGQPAAGQLTGDEGALPDFLPPPPAAEAPEPAAGDIDAGADTKVDVDSQIPGTETDVSPAPTAGAIIDAEPKADLETDADATIEADVPPTLNGTPERNTPSARADVDAQHRGKLGVYVTDRGSQVTVQSVMSGGAAANGGLQAGDEIISVNGQRVTTSAQLRSRLRAAVDADGMATIIVDRNGKIETIDADVSGRFVAQPSGDRVETYYRGPYVERTVVQPAYPYHSTYYYGPTYHYGYPYYYGHWYGWGYYPYCW